MCQNGAHRWALPLLASLAEAVHVSNHQNSSRGHAQKRVKRGVGRTKIGREGPVLILRCPLRSAGHLAAALVLFGVTSLAICGATHVEGSSVGGCIGSWDTLNCVVRRGPIGDPYVRQVPEPASDSERGVVADREPGGSSTAARRSRSIVTAFQISLRRAGMRVRRLLASAR